jgi:hypothetical protein
MDAPGAICNLQSAICNCTSTNIVPPFDIQIGRCMVVQDPWGTQLVLLDASKGLLVTDAAGNVTGNRAV